MNENDCGFHIYSHLAAFFYSCWWTDRSCDTGRCGRAHELDSDEFDRTSCCEDHPLKTHNKYIKCQKHRCQNDKRTTIIWINRLTASLLPSVVEPGCDLPYESVMFLKDKRKRTTSPFSFLIGTMSSRHQNVVPGVTEGKLWKLQISEIQIYTAGLKFGIIQIF